MRTRIAVVIISGLLFLPFLGSVRLFDWDEINFAECAREMIVTGDYMHMQIDYQPFYEKPPLFIWAQVICMKIFGVNEFAARLPNAVIGIITMLLLVTLGERIIDKRFGILWALSYACSLLPYFYFRSGIIDPMFNLFIFLGVLSAMRVLQGAGVSHALMCGVWSACAVMTKGPVGFGLVVITTLVAWIVQRKHTPRISSVLTKFLITTIVAVALSSVWFIVDLIQNGPTFVSENLAYQWRLLTTGEAGHEQPFWYHPVVIFFGCFPASIFMLGAWKRTSDETDAQRAMRITMVVLFFVVLVVFSLVKTKIIHYSSMTYLPLTYLAALNIYNWTRATLQWKRWRSVVLGITGTLVFAGVFAVLYTLQHKELLFSLPTFRDQFLRSSLLKNVDWFGWEPYLALIPLIGLALFLFSKFFKLSSSRFLILYFSISLFLVLTLPLVTQKIESLTQGSALDFYESNVGNAVYIKPLTMKSYAHLFYTQKPFELSAKAKGIAKDDWEPWLLTDTIDKPAYFVCKINDAGNWRENTHLTVLKEEGGFVFFYRTN